LNTLADSESPHLVAPLVQVQFITYDADIDFAAHSLVRDIADDHIIASLLGLKAQDPTAILVLLTKDIGLKLKARAQGFSTRALPDSAALPDEILPSERKLRDLETQVREMQNVRPKLRLAFSDGSQNLKLILGQYEVLSDAEIKKRISEIKDKYPKMLQQAATPTSTMAQISIYSMLIGGGLIDPAEIDRYNEKLDKFFMDYEEYLNDLSSFLDWERRTAEIGIMLVNDGSCPADDIDIFIHFPDGFELFEKDEYEKAPDVPKAPQKPISLHEKISTGFAMQVPNLWEHSYLGDENRFLLPAGRSNVGSPRIKRTKSYDVKIRVDKAKHGIIESLDAMYITFDSYDRIRSFTVEYAVHASNLPTPSKGSLNVII
jgi:hypothetical protein